MQGSKQYTGFFRCNWCLHPGEELKPLEIKYTLQDQVIEERTETGLLEDFIKAERTGETVHGAKSSRCALTALHFFNIVTGYVNDYMHSALLGVGRQFSAYWFLTSDCPFSHLNDFITRLSRYSCKFTPTAQIRRLAGPIEEIELKNAKEFENFILFFSPPLLHSGLPAKYVEHWALFVEALYILLQTGISLTELNCAKIILERFCAGTEELCKICNDLQRLSVNSFV